MSDFLVLVAASIPVSGALIVQIYESKASRRRSYDEKRLLALLDVRKTVEEAVGRWYNWASASLGQHPKITCDAARSEAEAATHNAWYSTRAFEMFFPTMMAESQNMRDEITRCKEESMRQVGAGGTFNGAEFSSNQKIDLDAVTRKGRKILGYPSE